MVSLFYVVACVVCCCWVLSFVGGVVCGRWCFSLSLMLSVWLAVVFSWVCFVLYAGGCCIVLAVIVVWRSLLLFFDYVGFVLFVRRCRWLWLVGCCCWLSAVRCSLLLLALGRRRCSLSSVCCSMLSGCDVGVVCCCCCVLLFVVICCCRWLMLFVVVALLLCVVLLFVL